jgi:hypothetical protein
MLLRIKGTAMACKYANLTAIILQKSVFCSVLTPIFQVGYPYLCNPGKALKDSFYGPSID